MTVYSGTPSTWASARRICPWHQVTMVARENELAAAVAAWEKQQGYGVAR